MPLLFILLIICVTLYGLFGLFVMLTPRGDRQANILLGAFFLLWALDFTDGLLMLSGVYLSYPQFALWNEAAVFLYGPILYFYTLRILRGRSVWQWRSLLHLIPFALMLVAIGISFHVHPPAKRVEILRSVMNMTQSSEVYLVAVLVVGHFFAYVIAAKREVAKAEGELSTFYSNYNLSWLNAILNALFAVLLISVIGNMLQAQQSSWYFMLALPILMVVMAIFIIRIFWNALQEPFLTLKDQALPKYATTPIVPTEKEIILQKIEQALGVDKVYLNPELTLSDFAEAIGYPSRQVSQVINECLDKNFFDLINTYRIEGSKIRLKNKEDAKLTILEVMYEVGFNSKSSFNTQFKKRVGLTPSEFMKLD